MPDLVTTVNVVLMTSLELVDFINSQRGEGEAELRHDHFMAKVPKVLGDAAPKFLGTVQRPQPAGGFRDYPCYTFHKREACLMAMSYSYDLQAKVFDRMTAMEQQAKAFDPASLTRIDILKLAMESEEGRIKAEAERDHAIATKAQIGSKREATAMATAAKATREVSRLMDRLGFNAKHATIKAVESATKRSFGPQGWRPLAAWCKAHGACAVDVPDPLYGTVKSWPADAWGEIYSVDLQDIFKVEA